MIQNAVACDNSGKPKEFQILSSCLSGYIAKKKWRTTVWRLVVTKEKRRSLRAEKRHTYTYFDGKRGEFNAAAKRTKAIGQV